MKFKNQNGGVQSLNPLLGFGWYTGIKTPKKNFLSQSKNYVARIKKVA